MYTLLYVHTYTDLAEVGLSVDPFQCVDEGQSPYVGSVVVMRCVAEGEPFPRVSWFFNGRKVRDSEVPDLNFRQSKRILNITSFKSNYSGDYYCRSESDVFPDGRQSSTITVRFQGKKARKLISALSNTINTRDDCCVGLVTCKL